MSLLRIVLCHAQSNNRPSSTFTLGFGCQHRPELYLLAGTIEWHDNALRGSQKFNSSDNEYADTSWVATYPLSSGVVCAFFIATWGGQPCEPCHPSLYSVVIADFPSLFPCIPSGRMRRLLSVPATGVNDWLTLIQKLV